MALVTRILPLALLAAAVIAGCGSDDSSETTAPAQPGPETTQAEESGSPSGPVGVRVCKVGAEFALMRVTNVACATGTKVTVGWSGNANCRPALGQLRSACTVGKYRCLATTTGQGISVSCARSGHSIAFLARPG